MSDTLTDALNSPSGRLVEVVIGKVVRRGGAREVPNDVRARLNKFFTVTSKAAKLARIRLAAEAPHLYEQDPIWTKSKILPLFDWTSPDAHDAWQALTYSNYIGSPEFFSLIKRPFLELFGRPGVSAEGLRTFAAWLTTILIVNQSQRDDPYPLAGAEARAALRRAGIDALSSVAHRLAVEMEAASAEQKELRWRIVVGPVFQSVWPLDVELQTHASTFKLVQILLATGDAFPAAADVIIPFIRPERPRSHTAIYSIATAPDSLFASSPSQMLDLVVAVVGDAPQGGIRELGEALARICAYQPNLADNRRFQKLMTNSVP